MKHSSNVPNVIDPHTVVPVCFHQNGTWGGGGFRAELRWSYFEAATIGGKGKAHSAEQIANLTKLQFDGYLCPMHWAEAIKAKKASPPGASEPPETEIPENTDPEAVLRQAEVESDNVYAGEPTYDAAFSRLARAIGTGPTARAIGTGQYVENLGTIKAKKASPPGASEPPANINIREELAMAQLAEVKERNTMTREEIEIINEALEAAEQFLTGIQVVFGGGGGAVFAGGKAYTDYNLMDIRAKTTRAQHVMRKIEAEGA